MKLKDYKEAKWFNGAVIACIGVAFFVLLTNFPLILDKIGHVLGYFHVIFLGMVLAYILNPVANFFYFRVFGKMKRYRFLWSVCVLLADQMAEESTPMYTGLDKVRFKAPVRPGDTIETECRVTRAKPPFFFAEGKATVDGKLCAKAEFSFAVVKEK